VTQEDWESPWIVTPAAAKGLGIFFHTNTGMPRFAQHYIGAPNYDAHFSYMTAAVCWSDVDHRSSVAAFSGIGSFGFFPEWTDYCIRES
jgi:hypothetical protein